MSVPTFSLAAGPHPRRALSLMPRLGFTVLGSAWPQALFTGGGAPPPPRAFVDASPRIHSPRLGMAAGAAVSVEPFVICLCLRGFVVVFSAFVFRVRVSCSC